MATPIPGKMALVAHSVEGIQTTQTSEWKICLDEQNKTIRRRDSEFSYFGTLSKEEKFLFESFNISVWYLGFFSIFSIEFGVVKRGDYRLLGWDI